MPALLSELVVVFDLDHTLIITDDYRELWSLSAESEGIPPQSALEVWNTSLGMPLVNQAQKLGMSDQAADRAIALFWEKASLVSPVAMPGAQDLLDYLEAHQTTMFLSTGSSPEAANRWLKHFGWNHYFKLILGSNRNSGKGPDHYAEIFAALENTNLENMVTIGDGQYDMIFGAQHGLKWTVGFASDSDKQAHTERLVSAGARIVVESLDEIPAVLEHIRA